MKRKLLPIVLLIIATSVGAQRVNPSPWLNSNQKESKGAACNLINTDLFTGAGDVSIPIYSYESNGMQLPLSLNYSVNAHGVDKIASNIGFGFELSIGGNIKRQVRGNPDDVWHHGHTSWAALSHAWIAPMHGLWFDETNDEPDIFYLQFGTRNIKFMIGRDGSVLSIPKTIIQIERLLNGNPVNGVLDTGYTSGADLSFRITDEGGNKYDYRKSYQQTVVDSSSPSIANTYWTVTYYPIDEWTISKVTTYEGDEITYDYDPVNIANLRYISQTFRDDGGTGTVNKKENKSYALVRLKAIHYPDNIKAVFVYDDQILRHDVPGDKRLTEIRLTEDVVAPGIVARSNSFLFEQSYFFSPDFTASFTPGQYFGNAPHVSEVALPVTGYRFRPTKTRLRLKSISQKGSDGSLKKLYKFDYNPVPLAERLYGGRDVYGYNNASVPGLHVRYSDSNYLQTTRHLIGSTYVGLDQTPTTDVRLASGWCLQKVTNQYGGAQTIRYGLNISGGTNYGAIRIDSIISENGIKSDENMVKRLEYSDAESYGREGSKHYQYIVYDPSNCSNSSGNGGSASYFEIYSNSCVVLNQGLNRSNYGYKLVNEYLYNGSGELSQKTATTFTGLSANVLPANGLALDVPPFANKQYVREWGVGLPVTTTIFDNNNRIKSSTTNTYAVTDDLSYQNTASFKCYATLPKSQGCFGAISGYYSDTYYPFTGSVRLAGTKTRQYVSDASYQENEDLYTFDTHMNPTVRQSTNSKGETEREYNFYSYNWNAPGFNNGLNPGTTVQKLNSDKVPKEIYSVVTRTINNQEKVLGIMVRGIANPIGNYVRDQYNYSFKAKNARQLSEPRD